MNKSLCKVLARMAKDGDVETVAEVIGEIIGPEDPEQAFAETEPETAEQPAETGETKNIIIDGDALEGLLERLDRIIDLLKTGAGDEDPQETAGSPEETPEAAAEEQLSEELAAAVEKLLDQEEPDFPECGEGDEESETLEEKKAGDAFYTVISALRPVLDQLPRKLRRRMVGDIAARVREAGRRGAVDSGIYEALVSASRRTAPGSAELGKRIMEKRNSAYARRHGEY